MVSGEENTYFLRAFDALGAEPNLLLAAHLAVAFLSAAPDRRRSDSPWRRWLVLESSTLAGTRQ